MRRRMELQHRLKNNHYARKYYKPKELTKEVTINVPMVSHWNPLQYRHLHKLRRMVR